LQKASENRSRPDQNKRANNGRLRRHAVTPSLFP
jgi:hypothetical protein